MICVEAKATPKRDQAIDAIIQKYSELWPQSLGEWEIDGKSVPAQYSYIDWNEEDGRTFINIEVRDESKVSDLVADLAMVGGCCVKVMDELEYRSEQMGEPGGAGMKLNNKTLRQLRRVLRTQATELVEFRKEIIDGDLKDHWRWK